VFKLYKFMLFLIVFSFMFAINCVAQDSKYIDYGTDVRHLKLINFTTGQSSDLNYKDLIIDFIEQPSPYAFAIRIPKSKVFFVDEIGDSLRSYNYTIINDSGDDLYTIKQVTPKQVLIHPDGHIVYYLKGGRVGHGTYIVASLHRVDLDTQTETQYVFPTEVPINIEPAPVMSIATNPTEKLYMWMGNRTVSFDAYDITQGYTDEQGGWLYNRNGSKSIKGINFLYDFDSDDYVYNSNGVPLHAINIEENITGGEGSYKIRWIENHEVFRVFSPSQDAYFYYMNDQTIIPERLNGWGIIEYDAVTNMFLGQQHDRGWLNYRYTVIPAEQVLP